MNNKYVYLVIIFLLSFATRGNGETFSPKSCLEVTANKNTGVITVTGSVEDIKDLHLLQYCPDGEKGLTKALCPRNNPVNAFESSSEMKRFQMNMTTFREYGQRSFTLKNRLEQWILIPNQLVIVKGDLVLESSMPSGGTMFTVADRKSYQSPYPFPEHGGQLCSEKDTKPQVMHPFSADLVSGVNLSPGRPSTKPETPHPLTINTTSSEIARDLKSVNNGQIANISGNDIALPTQIEPFSSGWVRRQNQNNSVIVFVHGVIGNAKDTWFNKKTSSYWPQLIAGDSDFLGVNLYAYEYNSPLIGKALSISSLASEMNERLIADGVLSHKNIVFIVHSMGGLVTRQFLLRVRETVANKIKMVYFLATPTTGSSVANLANLFSFNPQFQDMLPADLDGYLNNMIVEWQASSQMRAIASYCAFETQEIASTKIVPMASAAQLCNKKLLGIEADHIQIAKPSDNKALQYIGFKNAFKTECGGRQ